MGKLVKPEVYFIGHTVIDMDGMADYLRASSNDNFYQSMVAARDQGLSDGEILTSFYAKLCYASLTLGKNANVTRIRDIPDNLKSCWEQGHGSVWEHCTLNFVVRNCSRVYTHEQVRHRAGAAYSQTSGRYVRGDEVDIVFDPILEPWRKEIQRIQTQIESAYQNLLELTGLNRSTDFAWKKKMTSALRRFLPNGQSNELGFSLNLRSLRHIVQMRTSRHAEWEIREIFGQVYHLVKDKYPLLFHGAQEEMVDGIIEISNMKMQPYENQCKS